jgi:hypothetical protein
MLVVASGCGSDESTEAVDPVMPDVVGQPLDVALSDIAGAGIDSEVDVDGGGTFGIVDESNWEVCDQSPAAGSEVDEAPKLSVDRSCGNADETLDDPNDGAARESDEESLAEETLTPANNEDLAALLAGSDCGDEIEAFANEYQGKPIEFDGHVASIANHGDAESRFDILVLAGDFSETGGSGPNFQFRDVAGVDLNFTGADVPDGVRPGDNVHIVATVEEFLSDQCLLLLDPVATELR